MTSWSIGWRERTAFSVPGETVQKVVRAALGRGRFASSREGERQVVWPSPEEKDIVVYRRGDDRDHGDIPLGELAGLASLLAKQRIETTKYFAQCSFISSWAVLPRRQGAFREAIAIFRQSTVAVPVIPAPSTCRRGSRRSRRPMSAVCFTRRWFHRRRASPGRMLARTASIVLR